MTDSEKLARWQGLHVHQWIVKYSVEDKCSGYICVDPACGLHNILLTKHGVKDREAKQTPDYLNDDTACMSLLDTLVEKGFVVEVCSNDTTWACEIIGYTRVYKPTRREAVVAAVLKLIEKEDL